MKIIIPTCDKYCNILEANKYTMDKFGGSDLDVTILGYKKPDFDMDNWKFISLGEDTGVKNFSNDISKFFNDFNEKYFIYGNDDCIFTNEINLNFLSEIFETIEKIPNFGRMWLTQTPSNFYGGSKIIKNFGNYQIAEINQWANYRLSLQYSLWKTSYFEKYLIPNLNPWQWELRKDAKNDGASILLPVNNFVISVGHVMKKGKLLKNWYTSIYNDGKLSEKDIEIVNNIFRKHNII